MTTPVTTAEVEALEALLAKATQRPWSIDDDDGGPVAFIEPEINYGNGYEGEIKSKDARLIVAAVNALPRLLAALRAQDVAVERALRACADFMDPCADDEILHAAVKAGMAALKHGGGA